MDFERFLPWLLYLSFLPDNFYVISYLLFFIYSTLELPQMVQQKFDDYESDEASVRKRPKSILLTLDRGFDTITPYFQELTLKGTVFALLRRSGPLEPKEGGVGGGELGAVGIIAFLDFGQIYFHSSD